MKELVLLNQSFPGPLTFHTQIDLRVAHDDEMLALLADANFGTLFIGIETPNVESIVEASNVENYKTDILTDVKKIRSYG